MHRLEIIRTFAWLTLRCQVVSKLRGVIIQYHPAIDISRQIWVSTDFERASPAVVGIMKAVQLLTPRTCVIVACAARDPFCGGASLTMCGGKDAIGTKNSKWKLVAEGLYKSLRARTRSKTQVLALVTEEQSQDRSSSCRTAMVMSHVQLISHRLTAMVMSDVQLISHQDRALGTGLFSFENFAKFLKRVDRFSGS